MQLRDYGQFSDTEGELIRQVDAAHRKLPEGPHYLRIHFTRYMKRRRGVMALIYCRDLETGTQYSLGLSGRPQDSAAFNAIRSAKEGSIFWVEITLTPKGYSRIANLKYLDQDIRNAIIGGLAWDWASRGRDGLPLRVPYLYQHGRSQTSIMVVWPFADFEAFATDFADPIREFPLLLRNLKERTEFQQSFSRRESRSLPFIKYMEGSSDVNFDPMVPTAGIAPRLDGRCPFRVWHVFLWPEPGTFGIKRRRRVEQFLAPETGFARIMFKLLQPSLVIVVGAEVARRLPRLLRPFHKDGEWKLPALGRLSCMSIGDENLVTQQFTRSWWSDFLLAGDLSYFRKSQIGSKTLPADYWATFQKLLLRTLQKHKAPPPTSYSKALSDQPKANQEAQSAVSAAQASPSGEQGNHDHETSRAAS